MANENIHWDEKVRRSMFGHSDLVSCSIQAVAEHSDMDFQKEARDGCNGSLRKVEWPGTVGQKLSWPDPQASSRSTSRWHYSPALLSPVFRAARVLCIRSVLFLP